MNGDMLLDLLGEADDRFVMEAIDSRDGVGRKRLPVRVLLIAAAAAVTILLMGCVGVYLWLNELPVDPTRDSRFDNDLQEFVKVERESDLILFPGTPDSRIAGAMRDWLAFTDTYTYDIRYEKNPHPEVSEYMRMNYQCYTPEMVEKLKEIADKYQLNLGETLYSFHKEQGEAALKILGIDSLLREGSNFEIGPIEGDFGVPYNFELYYTLTLPASEGRARIQLITRELYRHKEYMPYIWSWSLEAEAYTQWQYTNKDGVQLRMAMTRNSGIMVAEQENGYMTLLVNLSYDYINPETVFHRQLMEEIADGMNFTFTPKAVEQERAQQLLEEAREAYRMGRFVFPGFEEYVKQWRPDTLADQNPQYVLVDITGEGKPDLLTDRSTVLLDTGSGMVEIVSYGPPHSVADDRIWMYEHHNEATHMISYTMYQMTEDYEQGEEIDGLLRVEGKWYQGIRLTPETLPNVASITETEAQEILDGYGFTAIEYDWKPLKDFPLSDGQTLEEYLNGQQWPMINEELRSVYADYLKKSVYTNTTHYRICDFNGDGTDDLLLSLDGQSFFQVCTYRYGRVTEVGRVGSFMLYENNVAGVNRATHVPPDTDITVQEYFIADESWTWHSMDYVGYNQATEKWYSGIATETTKDAVDAVIAKYRLAEQSMRPVEELSG